MSCSLRVSLRAGEGSAAPRGANPWNKQSISNTRNPNLNMKCDLEEHQHPTPHPSQSWVCAKSPVGCSEAPAKPMTINCRSALRKCRIVVAPHMNFLGNVNNKSSALSILPSKTHEAQLLPEITKNRIIKPRERNWERLLEQGSLAFVLLYSDFSGYYQNSFLNHTSVWTPVCSIWFTDVSKLWKKRRIRKGNL